MEEWKDVIGYEGLYQVSTKGRLKSLAKTVNTVKGPRNNKEKLIKLSADKVGYVIVRLYKDGVSKSYSLHRLLAKTFLGFTGKGHKFVVDHIDNNKLNNNIENLQIITNRKNTTKDLKGGTSNYVGVFWSKRIKKWTSSIYIKGKVINLGFSDDEKHCSLLYERAVIHLEEYVNNKQFRELLNNIKD